MPEIRVITESDIAAAMRLKEAANWNQTAEDWRNVMRLAPDGCFGLECGGILVASATAVPFGRELAWIGMVLTHPDYRGRGFARALMERAIGYLEECGAEWIKLDATDMGRPLYARLGFEDECEIERWARQPAPCEGPELPPITELPLALDREACGADRSELLGLLLPFETAAGPRGGYAMGRPGTNAAYFGPAVSGSLDEARQFVAWFVSRHAAEAIYWDLLPGNAGALALAREFGFAPIRKLVRMARPGMPGALPFAHNDCLVFGIAGFEFG